MHIFKTLVGLFFIALLSCAPARKMQKGIAAQIEKSPVFQKSFTGFALLDPESGAFIYEHQSDKYFTPASNTKIFTLYTCLQILEERPAVLRYEERDSAMIFWGTANPTLLHPTLNLENPIIEFLENTEKPLFFSASNFQDGRYGAGWAWDDYAYYFQPEKSALPIYGNVVTFERTETSNRLKIKPSFFRASSKLDETLGVGRPRVAREEMSNNFSYNISVLSGEPFSKEIPYLLFDTLNLNLLGKRIGRAIEISVVDTIVAEKNKILYGSEIFPVYQKMMIDSDNFLAEQLLLMCADKQLGVLNAKQVIAFAKDSIFQDLPDELLWRDGSGLSRYNMFTPRSIVRLLEKIHQELPEEKVFSLFPVGGESGTIEDWYGGKSQPYVFAKTGTLTGKHCLSGYVKTRAGKTLIFSFMHNNYKGSSKPLKVEMQRILEAIYE